MSAGCGRAEVNTVMTMSFLSGVVIQHFHYEQTEGKRPVALLQRASHSRRINPLLTCQALACMYTSL